LSGLMAAFQFLTILPVKRSFTAVQLGRSSVYFPLIGLAIGLILAGFHYVFRVFPAPVANLLLIVLLAILSGGIHLDGVADTMDGIAGHRTPAQRLQIMRDSRIGGFGAIGLIFVLMIQYVSLNGIPNPPDRLVVFGLILAPVVSRWTMVNAIFAYPYARPEGLGKVYKDAVTRQHFSLVTLVTAAVSVLLFGISGLIIMAGTWAIVNLLALYLKHQLTGLTGDTYGAVNEVATASVFLIITLLAYNHWLVYSWWV
jgi:adenosylcobinamide-GDP ribazoletransferase